MANDTRIPIRSFIGLILVLAVSVAWPGANRGAVSAQEEAVREMFVRVRDAATQTPVTDMRPDEFVASIDDVDCEIVSAELVATRMQLTLLLDDSGAMRNYHSHFLAAMPAFLEALPEGSDVSLITMADRPHILLDFTTDMARVEATLEDYFPRPSSGAAVIDTIHRTADNLLKENREDGPDEGQGVPEGELFRPVIAMIGSDAGDVSQGNNETKVNNLFPKLRALGATVHWLILENNHTGLQHNMAEFFTEATGGWSGRVPAPSPLAAETVSLMGAIIAQQWAPMANQYRVTFKVPPGADPDAGVSAGVRRGGVAVKVSLDGRHIG